MHKVDNAIILAAGRGSRLKHLTNDTPKPMLAPRGVRFIDDIIAKLKDKGINDIIVVTGYKSEKFDYLKDEVTLVKNENWDKGNNVTSVVAAQEHLANTLIVNGDIILKENVFQTEYKSSLTYVEQDKDIDEWIVNVGRDGNVDTFDKDGLGKQGLYQREIIFITKDLAEKISEELPSFDMEEYQEYLMIQTAQKNNIDFKTYEVKTGSVFDLDTVEEFNAYKK